MKRAVFLDRDGVINQELGYVYKVDDLRIIPGSIEAIKMLNDSGFLSIVVTNQAGIAYGYYSEEAMHKFNRALADQLAKAGTRIDAFFFCPHHAEKGIGKYKIDCACRKPKTGMFEQAVREFNIDPEKSFNVGDKWSDMAAGNKMGCKNIFVRTGHGKKELNLEPPVGARYDFLANDLYQAVTEHIIKNQP